MFLTVQYALIEHSECSKMHKEIKQTYSCIINTLIEHSRSKNFTLRLFILENNDSIMGSMKSKKILEIPQKHFGQIFEHIWLRPSLATVIVNSIFPLHWRNTLHVTSPHVSGQLPWFWVHPAVLSLLIQYEDYAHMLPSCIWHYSSLLWKKFSLVMLYAWNSTSSTVVIVYDYMKTIVDNQSIKL